MTGSERKVAHGLTEARIVCNVEDRDVYLFYLIKKYPGRTLVYNFVFLQIAIELYLDLRELHQLHEAAHGSPGSSAASTHGDSCPYAATPTNSQFREVRWFSVKLD